MNEEGQGRWWYTYAGWVASFARASFKKKCTNAIALSLSQPGESEEVTIILVDKDKQMLLTDFEQIGPGGENKFMLVRVNTTRALTQDFYSS